MNKDFLQISQGVACIKMEKIEIFQYLCILFIHYVHEAVYICIEF